MKLEIDLETTPCVIAFAHTEITMYYCSSHPQGATQDLSHADKYKGKVERMSALQFILDKYPQTKRKGLIFQYLPGVV